MKLLRIWLPILGFILGFGLVLVFLPAEIPYAPQVSNYVALALLAGLDSILGGIRAGFQRKFRSEIFISGFFVNILLAVLLAFLGDQIGVPLYLAAVVHLGGRIFLNLSVIRRLVMDRKAEAHPAADGREINHQPMLVGPWLGEKELP